MNGFDFGQIGKIISEFMDSDFFDIKRNDGSELKEIYSNVPCHISFNSTDNPDPTSVDTKPIIQSITVHTQLWVDVQNDDFLVVKRMGSNGELLQSYSGRCGNPVVSQGRKKVLMQMNATGGDTPTPPPPINPTKIMVDYFFNDEKIKTSDLIEVEIGERFELKAPEIEGYRAINSIVDLEIQGSDVAIIEKVEDRNYEISFIYKKSDKVDSFRFLVNGLYTKDDGSLANGYHLYKSVKIDAVEYDNIDRYVVNCDNVKLIHEDNGKKLELKVGTKIVLMPSNIFVEIEDVISTTSNKISFLAVEYEPTEQEKNAYVTDWYNGI